MACLNAMNLLRSPIASALLISAGLTGCDFHPFSPPPAPPLSEEAIATRDTPAELQFKGQLAGTPVHLLVHDCEVFRVEPQAGGEVQWTSVLKPAFYPFWTVCQRQRMSFDAKAVTVTLGRMAVGAGGCCATGGTYRTVDGLTWKAQ